MIVLLHRFPQTWKSLRRMIPLLTAAGVQVIAPDYRGAGNTSRPAGGYDKRTMAPDIHTLLREHVEIRRSVIMVGHDIGVMVAYALAEMYGEDTAHLVVVDAPLPGTAVFDELRSNRRLWHFAFHGTRDVPEMLVAGRERQYLQAFFDARASILPRSMARALRLAWQLIQHRARCAPDSSCIEPSIRIFKITAML